MSSEPVREDVVYPRSPEGIRAAVLTECVRVTRYLIDHMDQLLMDDAESLEVVVTFMLPGEVKVRFTGSLDRVEP